MIHALLFILTLHVGVNFIGYSLQGAQPAITTTLSAGMTASDTVIPVASVTGFPSAGWLYIQGEAIEYTAATTTCPAPFAGEPACFTGGTRGGQETTAVSHSASQRVYSEAAGLVNDLSEFENRTSVSDLGRVDAPWSSGPALLRFLSHAVTWDWPMFEGGFALFRIFGGIFTAATVAGIGIVLYSLVTGSIRSLT